MKKYLIKGALALFAGAFLFSCSEKETEYVPLAQMKLKTYEEVFKAAYGDIDPYQNWGFSTNMDPADESEWEVVYIDSIVKVQAGTRAGTREDIDVNTHVGAYPDANMWTSKGFLAPPPLTLSQKLRAQYYFQMNQNPGGTDNYGTINFFMQQVYDGGTDAMDGKSPEVYDAADGSTKINSGEHMDHLTAGPDHLHIYNFNNGNCSTNSNVANRDQTDVNDTKQQHSDEIMLMLNTPTSCFGYANSDASYVRDDRWTLVSASTIDAFCDGDDNFKAWLTDNKRLGSGEDVKCDDEYHRGFIGFDFDMLPESSIFSSDYYKPEWFGEKYHYLSANRNQYCGESQTVDPEPADKDAALALLNDGWLPAIGSANKTWVKVGGCNDGYYSDWIVSFLPAGAGRTSETETRLEVIRKRVPIPAQCGRIFCEDLAVSNREDLDFNDVVFDVYVYKNFEEGTLYYTQVWSDGERVDIGSEPYSTENNATYTCEIILQAAGGTLPLTINDIEVHNAFGVGVTTMVNTYDANTTAYGSFATRDAVNLGEFKASEIIPGASDTQELHAADIPLYVNYESNQINYIGSTLGGTTAKIFVPNYDTRWTVERKAIELAYPKFRDFVGDHHIMWYDDSDLKSYLTTNKGKSSEEADALILQAEYSRHGNNAPVGSYSYTSPTTPPIVITHITYPASSEDNLWTGSEDYSTSSWVLKDLSLSFNSFSAGDHILFHVEDLTANSTIAVVYADNSRPYFLNTTDIPNYKVEDGVRIPADKGVIEVELDEDNAAKLTSTVTTYGKIQVQGCNFTLKKIGRVRATTN